jgi:hypothetical protein
MRPHDLCDLDMYLAPKALPHVNWGRNPRNRIVELIER